MGLADSTAAFAAAIITDHDSMNFEEHAAKALLATAGIPAPDGELCGSADNAATAAGRLGPCAVKAQVPTGKRGKAGGIRLAETADQAADAARAILGMEIDGHRVERVLVERQVAIARELYVAVLNDPASKGPLLLASAEGGMEIEELAEDDPGKLLRQPIDILAGFDGPAVRQALEGLGFGALATKLAVFLADLYALYRDSDAELLEINPLAVTETGDLVALDCKFTLDDSAIVRQPELAGMGTPDKLTGLEERGRAQGLKFIELEGNVGVLANGAGLTMTTMDAVRHYGGQPANFLEIGGDAYTKGKAALELVLANPGVKALLVNFCGAFARTDVMTEGLLEAWAEIGPDLPVFFSIHGTGEDEAIALVRDRLGIEPFDLMDDAVKAAVGAAQAGGGEAAR